MARLFNDAVPEYLYINTAIMSAPPFAWSVLCRINDKTVNQNILWLGDKDATNQTFRLAYLANTYCYFNRNDGTSKNAVTAGDIVQDEWFSLVGIVAATNDCRIIMNGTDKGTETTVIAPAGIDKFTIGIRGATALLDQAVSGDIAEVAMWNLSSWPGATAADKANNFESIAPSLYKRYTPEFFPLGRIAYWDLRSGIKDRQGAYDLTASGTILSAHPRIIRPTSVLYGVAEAYVPPVSEGGIMTCNTGYWGAI